MHVCVTFDITQPLSFNMLLNETVKTLETLPLPAGFGFHLVQDISIGDTLCLTVSHHDQKLRARAVKWFKGQDYARVGNLLDMRRLNGNFMPMLQSRETEMTAEESEYFPGFYHELLHVPEGQVLEKRAGIVLDGSRYCLQLFESGKTVREFRWNDQKQTRGIMSQVLKLMNRVSYE